jgi:photosystem II stability/assembly factor-like uncharacterized protein
LRNLLLVGTAVTRPDAVGSLYRLRAGSDWHTAGDIPADASVQAITPHSSREDVVFLATRKGLYRSTDAGESWARLDVTDEDVQFWSVVVSPHDPDVIFVGTGPVGAFRSADGGDTWSKCQADHPERFKITFGRSRTMRIAFHPTDPTVMYAVAEINGLLVSEDGGVSWRGEPTGLAALAALPHLKNTEVTDDDTEGMFDAHSVCTTTASPDVLFYICRLGIFESSDKGKTFLDLEVGKFAPFSYTRDCRFPRDNAKKMYACFSISSRSNAGALYSSDDLGKSWYRVDEQVEPRSTIMGLGLHVTDPAGIVTVTRGGQVFYTVDGAVSWTETQLPSEAGDAFCGAIL